MIQDALNLFSDEQAITATAVSTNAIDLGNPNYGDYASPGAATLGGHLYIRVDEDFATLTSLTIALQESSDDGDSDAYADKITHTAIPVAELTAGKMFYLGRIPIGIERYVRLNYTVTGSNATAGKVTAGIAMDVPANW